jgi:ornithine carbamoyltransferase
MYEHANLAGGNAMKNLHGRSFLTLLDYSTDDIRLLLDTAHEYKRLKYAGESHRSHAGKSIALLFEKTSTRTRCAFEVAAADLGINVVYLGKDETQFGKKESVEDTAKVLGRMFDGIEFRGYSQEVVETLAKHSGVPVWNGLTDKFHPTQVLADFMTIEEKIGRLRGVKLVFVGDGSDNVSNSLMIGAAKMGMHYVISSPDDLRPPAELLDRVCEIASENGGSVKLASDITEAVRGADAIYTDVWVSMGQEDLMSERISKLKNYQVNMDTIHATHNSEVLFLHCLPAFHDTNTVIGAEVKEQYGLDAMEVTDEVFRSHHSVVFDEAENRMHTIKALISLTL